VKVTGSSPRFRLFHYWRSSASWRVRFALELKKIQPLEMIAVNLLADESDAPAHRARNPMGHVPVIELVDAPAGSVRYIGESLAILEWLNETHATVGASLWPSDPARRARARQLAELINSGTQPLTNLGINTRHSSDEAEQKRWNQEWIRKGLGAFEQLAAETAGRFCLGDDLTIADVCLAPQIYAAGRNEVSLDAWPTIARVHAEIAKHPAYLASHPDRSQPQPTQAT
jgi:maleylpyruvate isomerase